MRICFVGPASSTHIVKWCNWFTKRKHDVHVISFDQGEIAGAVVHSIDIGVDANGSDFGKLKYLLAGGRIKRIVEELQPDVVNVHYATSYGAACALSGVKHYVLSVWGADIYDFPKKSPLHRALLEFSLNHASMLFSTSRCMSNEAAKYTDKHFSITPFGVDTDLFSPNKRSRDDEERFIVGTIKGLSEKYGIRQLLEATAYIAHEGEIPIELRIAGKGPQERKYQILANEIGIGNITHWLGYINQEQAALEWANMDVAVIPSTLESESFGVAAVEAQACGTAVIISDIPGLMEATAPGVSSLVVKRNDPQAIAESISDLYHDRELTKKLGRNGRQYAIENYNIDTCFRRIEALLTNASKEFGSRH